MIEYTKKHRKGTPTQKDIELYSRVRRYLEQHGTKAICPNCGEIIIIPKPIDKLSTEEYKRLFRVKTYSSFNNRVNKWVEYGWVQRTYRNKHNIKVKQYYPIRYKNRIEKFNKKH